MRVPVLEGPSVAPSQGLQTPAPGAYRAPDLSTARAATTAAARSIGAGLDRGLERFQKMEADAANQAREVATGDALLQYQRYANGRFNGTTESDAIESAFEGRPTSAGFLRLRGVAASEASAGLIEDLEKERLRIGNGLADPQARAEFNRRSAQVNEDHRRTVESHVGQQLGVASEATARAQREMALNDIANNFRDPESVARQQSIVEPLLRAQSLSPEDAKARVEEFQADAAKVRLGSYIAQQDWAGAQALFSQSREKLGASAVQFQKTIEAGMVGARAENEAANIIENSTDAGSGWVYSPKALYELDQMPNGQLKDETRQRLEHRLSIAEKQKTQAIDARFNNALSALIKGGTLSAVNPADKTYLQDERNDPMKWVQLENLARTLDRRARGRGGAGASLGAKMALAQLQVDMVDHPERYAQLPVERFISEWYPKLDPKDWEQAGGLLAAAHGKALKPDQLTPLETKALLQRGRDRGLFPDKQNDVSKWDDEQASRYYDAINQLQEWAAAEKRQTGKTPPFEKMQAEIDRLLLQGFKPGTGFMGFNRKKTTLLESGDAPAGFEPAWTDSQKQDAISRIKASGKEPTDELVDHVLRRVYRIPSLPVQRAAPKPPPAPEPSPTALERSTDRKTDRVY